jgi:hypothetical protein
MIIKRTLFVRRLLYGYFSSPQAVLSTESAAEPVVKETTDIWSLASDYRLRRG